MKHPLSPLIIGSLLAVLIIAGYSEVWALSVPPSEDMLKSKLSDTLKSVTSNVSSSIQSDIDKAISSTMDLLIESSMKQLINSTILENSDSSSTVSFNEVVKPFPFFNSGP